MDLLALLEVRVEVTNKHTVQDRSARMEAWPGPVGTREKGELS